MGYHLSFQGDPKTIKSAMYAGNKGIFSKFQRVALHIKFAALMCIAFHGGIALFIVFRILLGHGPTYEHPILLPTAGLLAGALILWFQIWPVQVVANRAAQGALGKDVEMVLNSEGLDLIGGHSKWFTAWGDVDNIEQTKTCVCFVIGAIVIHIPFYAFESDDTRQAALADINRWFAASRSA